MKWYKSDDDDDGPSMTSLMLMKAYKDIHTTHTQSLHKEYREHFYSPELDGSDGPHVRAENSDFGVRYLFEVQKRDVGLEDLDAGVRNSHLGVDNLDLRVENLILHEGFNQLGWST
eukprot:10884957-Karenia_brevis.AAC.1